MTASLEGLSAPPQSTTDVSAVICAYTLDRWDYLLAAIDSLRTQSHPPAEILVVVDHNPQLLAQLREHCPDLRIADNAGPKGLSGGRNTALRLAESDYVSFLDDDATADHDWLATLTRELEARPNVLGVGSRVEPIWHGGRPAWWPREFDWVVGCSHRGLPTRRAEVRNPSGGAMVLRRSLLHDVGEYRTDLGRIGTKPLGGEESEYCLRASRITGGVFEYEPATAIQHNVPVERSTLSYLLRRCYSEGLSKAVIAKSVPSGSAALATERSYALRALTSGVLRGISEAVRGDLAGLGRAGAIVAGFSATTIGFLRGARS